MFKIFLPTVNKILLIFIEYKTKKNGNWNVHKHLKIFW